MANNDEYDRGLEDFIKYAEEAAGERLTDWERAIFTDVYRRYGPLEVHAYVDKSDREYDKVDDELSDFVDEFMSTKVKGARPTFIALDEVAETVREAVKGAGYSGTLEEVESNMADGLRDMARDISEAIDAEVVKYLDDGALGRLVDLVNDEWASRGHITPKDEEQLHTPEYGEAVEADATTRAYAASHGAYLGALMASGFNRSEAMAMVMFELQADLARDIHGTD